MQLSEMSEANAGVFGELGGTADCLLRFRNIKHALRTKMQFTMSECVCVYMHVRSLPNTLNVLSSEFGVRMKTYRGRGHGGLGGVV